MPRKVKRACSSSTRRIKRCYKRKLTLGSRKKKIFCECRRRRQSRKRMRGSGYGSGSGSGLGGSPIPTNKV